jgi:hypothetical protein
MNAANDDNNTPRGLRGWWASPPRRGMRRLIVPWEFRHLRGFGITRIAGGGVAVVPALICLAYGVYGWAAFFAAIAAANFAGGAWYLSIDRSQSAGA